TYLANQPRYRSYLSASYARRISQSPLPLQLVRSLTPEQLANSLDQPNQPVTRSSSGN
ncbi:MAG: hypothetical protein F6K28_48980, partial [Microcoleus sp. SIO2G3]|nr:hypothetical protein [Microcoleus sp. SIO2G3]